MKTLTTLIMTLMMVLILLGTLNSQESEEQLNLEIIELKEKINALQNELKQEQDYFKKFEKEKELLFKEKQQQQKNLLEEVAIKKKTINLLKQNLNQIDFQINQLQNENKEVNQILKQLLDNLKEAINIGIPFEQERRKSVLSSLLIDINTSELAPSEIMTRLYQFLKDEEAMAYDSQVVRTLIDFQGAKQEVTLVRVGRIFFAVQIKEQVFMFNRTSDGFKLASEPADLFTNKEVLKLIAIIQAQRPPEMIELPLTQIETK